MRIAWSGHRPDLFREPDLARTTVERLAREAVATWGAPEFVCGGQRGVDQWAAVTGCELGLAVQLILPSPPGDFTRHWSSEERAALDALLGRVRRVVVVDPKGSLGALAYDLRNETLVRKADRLLVVWTETRRGGTFHTICAARARGIPIQCTVLGGTEVVDWRGRGI